ncbi:unnamed protein product [Bursaphelenchus xylophilus]|uniref:Nuclear cap-binding protein subunit 1 n=1 Tax=Bursaphelenchus xylophilus TaxID=6326 RepID=A0A1I7SAE3_BURXY|nr:unnamed protein product [Bursaphelenchus xylophilus]CAG9084002.1 unnamed protein product [Bursaphelenchus xylophilus]
MDRRRRHNSDDERGPKRRRVIGGDGQDTGNELLDKIANAGLHENTSIETSLEALSSELSDKLQSYENDIIDCLSNCVAYKPERMGVYSTLAGLLNQKNNEFGDNLVSRLVSDLKNRLVAGEWAIIVRLVTFFGDLVNSYVLTADSVSEFFLGILDNTTEVNLLNDFYVYCVMHSLPWVGAALAEKNRSALDEILLSIRKYLEIRPKNHLKILGVWESSAIHEQEDYLDSLWGQLNRLKEDNWLEKSVSRFYVGFDSVLNQAIAHNLPIIEFPKFDEDRSDYPLPRVVFRLFDEADCPENDPSLPPSNSIDRFLVEEDISWIIDNNYLNFKLCANELLSYQKRDTVPINYVIIEVVFSQLFRLPNSPHLELFYGSLLLELCRAESSSMPQVLAQAAELLYQRCKYLHPACLDRMVDWFSFHLSNFQFRWSWSEWTESVKLSAFDKRQIFVREVFEKCLRLAYHEKLTQILPEEFEPLIPAKPVISYVMDDSDHPLFEQATLFSNAIKARKTSEDILLDLQKERLASGDNVLYDPEAVSVFTSVVLNIASKTFSHTFAAFTKYVELFRTVCYNNREMQGVVLRTVYDAWIRHKQMLSVLGDKLLKMRIVEPISLVTWIFSEDLREEFYRNWTWELVNLAVYRLFCQLKVLKNEIELLKQQSERQKKFQMVDEAGEFEDVDSVIEERKQELQDLDKGINEVILLITHRFTDSLSELINESNQGMDDGSDDFQLKLDFVLGRFKQFFLNNLEIIWERSHFLHSEVFSNSQIHPQIKEIYEQFRSLKRA